MNDPTRGARWSAALAAALLVTVTAPLGAQTHDWFEMSSRRQVDGVSQLDVDVEYAVGRLVVDPADAGLLYRMDLRYDANQFQPKRTWSADAGTGRLGLQMRTEDGNIELGDLDNVDSKDLGTLELGLSREIPTTLSLGVMAAEAKLDLGGLALQRFVFRTGASEARIDFDAPNPVRMDRLELAAGAADFEATGLGNARFDSFEFTGAVGDVRLDFTGDWEGSAEGEIRMGLGSLSLTFPRDIGVRIEKQGFLTSFNSAGFEEVDGGYQTANWDEAANRLTLEVRAGLGDIDVDFVD
ncbi:MAG: hypothetical protein PVF05_10465 [Gemmatimonadales bacterium]|jgi:hypothetical protein